MKRFGSDGLGHGEVGRVRCDVAAVEAVRIAGLDERTGPLVVLLRASAVEPAKAVQIPEDDIGVAATALDPTGHEHSDRPVA